MMRTRAIEVLFWGALVVAAGLVLGVWPWLLHYGLQAAILIALAIVVVGTPLLVLTGALRFSAWQLGLKPRR